MSIAEKLTTIAENEQKVYDAGFAEGKKDGQASSDDSFWDAYQKGGDVTFNYAFAYWPSSAFYPKHDIKLVGNAEGIFLGFAVGEEPFDLAQRLSDCGVALDTSAMTGALVANYYGLIRSSKIATMPDMDLSAYSNTSAGVFEYAEQLHTIGKITVAETTAMNRWFVRCMALVDVEFDGEIGYSGVNVSWSTKLSHDSIMSLINHLKDYSGSGTAHNLTLGASNLNKLTDAEKAIATERNWTLS